MQTSPLNEKMLLILSCFAFLSVHYYPPTVASALPVTEMTELINQVNETEPKNITVVLANSSLPGPLDFQHSSNTSNQTSERSKNEEKAEKEEFQPCKVSNVTYQHKERIPRADPCDMCVCVDSEMYCFWKLCTLLNSTNFTPASSSASVNNLETEKQSKNDNKITLSKLTEADVNLNTVEASDEKFSKILKNQRKYNALKKLEATSAKSLVPEKAKTSSVPSTTEPTICYVMGVMYKYGEVLPRDTGTCLECACSEGGRVTCSPKDCVSQPDLDYLSHNNNLDMFDLDTF